MKNLIFLNLVIYLIFIAGSVSTANGGPQSVTVVNSANFNQLVSPSSIASVFGSGLSTVTATSSANPLPTELAGVSVMLGGRQATLSYVSPTQINFVVPEEVSSGTNKVSIILNSFTVAEGSVNVAQLSPGIYTIDGSGSGIANAQSYDGGAMNNIFDNDKNPIPVNVSYKGQQNFLILYGTGFRKANLDQITVQLDGFPATVTASLPQPSSPGLDQMNILIPSTLSYLNDKLVSLQINVAGNPANTVQVKMAQSSIHSIVDLQKCISESINTRCALAPGNYLISNPLNINRGGLVIDGQGAFLQRSGPGTLVEINIAKKTGYEGLTIKNFTFENDDATGNSRDQTLMEISQADTGLWVADPFKNQGPYSVTISNCTFNHGQNSVQQTAASGIVTTAIPSLDIRVNDLYIHDNYFNWSNIGFFGNDNFGTAKDCDSVSDYKNDHTTYNPRNVRIENNQFYNVAQGALCVNEARWVSIRNNSFKNDVGAHLSGTDAGGELFLDQCSDTVEVTGNILVGPPPSTKDLVDGLEMYGRNIIVSNNDISGYFAEGIMAANFLNMQIINNNVHDNNWGYQNGGILIHDDLTLGAPTFSRQGSGLKLSGNRSDNQTNLQKYALRYGIYSGVPVPIGVSIDTTNKFGGNSWGDVCADSELFPLDGPEHNPRGVTSQFVWKACR